MTALIIHKRRGKGKAEDQWVTTTLGELVALLNGHREHLEGLRREGGVAT